MEQTKSPRQNLAADAEAVERVAKAIYEADDVWSAAFPWPTMPSDQQSPSEYRRIARAAIKAFVEGSPE